MSSAQTIADVETLLRPYSERSRSTKFTLDTTRQLATSVGNPEERLRVVHLAGTSGKTTTSYYAAGLLQASGQKVGLTVSPHIVSIRERVQLNGRPIAETKFIGYFNEFFALVEATSLTPSYFEFMMVFALWVFDREQVDYAVVETGLGGLHDTSNICRRPDKICIITDIGYDHMHILGNTLGEIAAQKAGIIAPENIAVMYGQAPEIMKSVQTAIDREDAVLKLAPEVKSSTYFERNFNLAVYGYEAVAARDGLHSLSQSEKQQVFDETHVPGRLEKIVVEKTSFILDGAHNEQKLSALFSTLDALEGTGKRPVVLALKADKDIRAVSKIIALHASEIVTTEFRNMQDTPVQATPAEELAGLFDEASAVIPLEKGLQYFLDRDVPVVLVTGSFFAVSEARAWLLNEKHGKIEI